MDQHQFLFIGCTFLGIAGCAFALMAMIDPYRARVQARVDALNSRDEAVSDSGRTSMRAGMFARFFSGLQNLIPHRANSRLRLQQRLSQAGIYDNSTATTYFAAKFLLIAVPPIIAIAVACISPLRFELVILVGLLVGAVGSILPGLWLNRLISQRHLMLRRSLPDFLDLMIVCLEGGLSIQESIRRVGEELQLAHPGLALELGIVQRDIELGASVAQALKRFALRTHYEGVRTLSTFVREAQRFGTNLSEALRLHSDMLRSQREQAAEESAQKAAVKILLPTLLLIFPAIFVVLVGPALIQIQEAFGAK